MNLQYPRILILSLVLLGRYASAAIIDFEDYSTGEVVGQTALGSSWSGTSGIFKISDVGGNQFFESGAANTFADTYKNVSYNLSSSFFDGDTAPATEGFTGIIDISFDIAVGEVDGYGGSLFVIQLVDGGANYSGDKPLEMYIQGNGGLGVKNGAATESFTDVFTVANDFVTVNAVMDFGTQTFGLSFDNSYQGSYAFKNTADGPLQLRIQANNINSFDSNYTQMRLDNVSAQVIPEPSSLALLLCALGVVLLRGRLRR